MLKEAAYVYGVRFWVAPEARERVFAWLEGTHVQEVVNQPGFLWCRRIDLGEKDERGWEAQINLYGLTSREARSAYQANQALHEKFARENAGFVGSMRAERFFGTVVRSANHA